MRAFCEASLAKKVIERDLCCIIAPRTDVHAFAVAHAGEEFNLEFIILDTAEFPQSLLLETHISQETVTSSIFYANGSSINLSRIVALWWRRPQLPNVLGLIDPSYAEFAIQEGQQALFGSLKALVPRAFNDPSLSRSATQKLQQLARARVMGFTIPDTLVATDPSAVRSFYEKHRGNVIYKPFKAYNNGLFPTRRLSLADLEELASLTACPCIFQEFVPGDFDIRATVVGEKCFSARIDYDHQSELIDTRLTALKTTPHVLPNELHSSLVRFVHSFGLVYGTMDLRFSQTRGYTFFELNPEGQYLLTEIEAVLPISRAIASYMAAGIKATNE